MNKSNSSSYSLSTVERILSKTGLDQSFIGTMLRHIREWRENDFLRKYQEPLSLWAEHLQDTKQKVIVTLDGRDTAGKWSNIKRVTQQLDTKRYDVKAFPWIPKPEEKFEDAWFQRYEAFFPEDGNIEFFDRSWYNRLMVEAVMWFCREEEYNWVLQHVNQFERKRIIDAGYDYLKIYLSIGKQVQKERLDSRKGVRKRWKSSPVDEKAQAKWQLYTLAKQRVLEITDTKESPWIILDSTEKFLSAVEIMKAIIGTRTEVRKMVENDLSIDLSPNPKIRRTATQELEKMVREWQIPVEKEFPFLPEVA